MHHKQVYKAPSACMLSLGESEGIPQKKLKIRCQETEFGGTYKENTILFIPLLCIATRAIYIDIDALSPFYNE